MIKIELNKSNNNPFYGLKSCLALFQNASGIITLSMLDAAYNEVKNNKEHRELFYSLLFSIGDITNRHHNIFANNKVDNGGNANRDSFRVIMNWMYDSQRQQFLRFLWEGLFNEYSCFDMLLSNRVRTKGSKVIGTYNTFANEEQRELLANYLYKIINGTSTINKMLVAKFLTLPRLSVRTKHKKMLPETKKIMEDRTKFLITLSKLMGWEYEVNGTYANFKGYRQWRKQYNQSFESVLFSTGSIFDMDKSSFLKWFDSLPAQARFRTKNRILYSKNSDESYKYPQLQEWYREWEAYKTKKQEEERVLTEKVRQGQATEEDKVKLEKVKKEAKVTVGATNFKDIYKSIIEDNMDELRIESFMNKVNLPYNSLVILDDSGSMAGAPFNFGAFLAAVCLYKNPDDDARNLLGFFNSRSHWHSFIDVAAETTPNMFVRAKVAQVKKSPFIDPKLSFYQNYRNIRAFCNGAFQNGGTNISAIPDGLANACREHPEMLDALKSYPIWTIISDGEWNNLRSPEASINDFFRKCEQYFGFKPFIVAIDIAEGRWSPKLTADRFSGIDNMIYIPSNPGMIEQFLMNFKDMDTLDVYTPLQSIYRSNRYELVRKHTI